MAKNYDTLKESFIDRDSKIRQFQDKYLQQVKRVSEIEAKCDKIALEKRS